ncbi:hypothetical protein [Nostoc sp. NMS8]|uniref:hypothetical protein n=1 Tax=Nostoc sp. NMS8 TaxID=2815392 RepID=UPI00345A5311
MLEEELNLKDNFQDKMPAGGSEANSFDCKEAWYPVHYLEDLDKSKPTAFTVLEKDIVI